MIEQDTTVTYDCLIIGAGVVGSAIARELSRYCLNIGVLEKEPDVCCETSARNSGVLHAGFNNKPGSLMARFCVEGNRMFDQIAKELDIPYKRTGKLIVGFNEDDRKRLEQMKATGEVMGIGRTLEECLLKSIRSLEIGVCHLYMPKFDTMSNEDMLSYIVTSPDDRIYAIAPAFLCMKSSRQP